MFNNKSNNINKIYIMTAWPSCYWVVISQKILGY